MGGILSAVLGGNEVLSSPASSESWRIKTFNSAVEWKSFFDTFEANKLMVIDFSAKWCGPCRMMEPIFGRLTMDYPEVEFVKIDVDELPSVAQEYGIQGMPTFVLVKDRTVKHTVTGAKEKELKEKIKSFR
ncbi:thioredoxin H2 [Carica papaya]|uniref:thioredoxin H2 n=1 Tax=Carica papaya TaxID=3649 RepID=UPI000B8CD6F1|nr:thioredoxin H2 [Carica papaya]